MLMLVHQFQRARGLRGSHQDRGVRRPGSAVLRGLWGLGGLLRFRVIGAWRFFVPTARAQPIRGGDGEDGGRGGAQPLRPAQRADRRAAQKLADPRGADHRGERGEGRKLFASLLALEQCDSAVRTVHPMLSSMF